MKDKDDKYGDFLRSSPTLFFAIAIWLPLIIFLCAFLVTVLGETEFSFGLFLEDLVGLLCAYIGIRGLIKFIRYFRDPEEKEKRKNEARRKAAIANLPSKYDPFASSASAPRSEPVTVNTALNQPNILQRYRAARAYLDACGKYDEEKLREMNRITGNMFPEAEIQKQLAQSEMLIGGMDEVKRIHYDTLTKAIAAFEKVGASGIDLSKYDV
ncbi:MAG: hypothetical protein IK132_10095 [Clostridia bacterium]|nr:hypothetical protein [Clostridia bacterium]